MQLPTIREMATNPRWKWLRWGGLLLIVLGVIFIRLPGKTETINSYASCAVAGYAITYSDPPVCRGPNKSYAGPRDPIQSPVPEQVSRSFTLYVNAETNSSYPAGQQIISNQPAWEVYWRAVHSHQSPVPPIPTIDFSSQDVIAISSGPKPTAGYNLRVIAVLAGATGSTIDVNEQIPTITCDVAQTSTNRYFIATTAKLLQPVNFRSSTSYRRCK